MSIAQQFCCFFFLINFHLMITMSQLEVNAWQITHGFNAVRITVHKQLLQQDFKSNFLLHFSFLMSYSNLELYTVFQKLICSTYPQTLIVKSNHHCNPPVSDSRKISKKQSSSYLYVCQYLDSNIKEGEENIKSALVLSHRKTK